MWLTEPRHCKPVAINDYNHIQAYPTQPKNCSFERKWTHEVNPRVAIKKYMFTDAWMHKARLCVPSEALLFVFNSSFPTAMFWWDKTIAVGKSAAITCKMRFRAFNVRKIPNNPSNRLLRSVNDFIACVLVNSAVQDIRWLLHCWFCRICMTHCLQSSLSR